MFVQYADSVVDGIGTVKSLFTTIIERSQDYAGHDHPWRPPDSWRREDRDVLDKAKAIISNATSTTGQGKDLQLIQSAMASSCRLSLTTDAIVYYRKRLVAGASSKSSMRLEQTGAIWTHIVVMNELFWRFSWRYVHPTNRSVEIL